EIDFAAEIGAVGAFAPGRDQGNAEQIFEEPPVGLVILDHIGVVMETQRQLTQKLCLGTLSGFDRVHRLLPRGWSEHISATTARQLVTDFSGFSTILRQGSISD